MDQVGKNNGGNSKSRDKENANNINKTTASGVKKIYEKHGGSTNKMMKCVRNP